MEGRHNILVLGVGNDILSDDAVGLVAAREIKDRMPHAADVMETNGLGLDLLDIMEGYEYALLLDSAMTGGHEPGTLMEFTQKDFSLNLFSSPHYAGLPEVLGLAEKLKIPFPKNLRILAMEAEDPYLLHEGLTASVENAVPEMIKKGMDILRYWRCEGAH